MANNTFLKVINGNVFEYSSGAQKILTYYDKGNATRADWFERDKGSIEVQTKEGKTLIISKGCQVIKII